MTIDPVLEAAATERAVKEAVAKERAACAKTAVQMVKEAVAEEREACAQIAEDERVKVDDATTAKRAIAAAFRARGG